MANPTDGDSLAAIAETIARWSPAGLGDNAGPPAALTLAREHVTAAGPRSCREARTALRYAYDYLTTRTVAASTNADEVYATDRVDTYVESLDGPDGSRNARRSFLKRLHPAIGLAGTTRTTTARPAPATPVPAVSLPVGDVTADLVTDDHVAQAVAVLDADVAAAIRAFRPDRVAADRWAQIASLVQLAAAGAGPATPARARDLCRIGAYLAGWVDSQGRTLRPSVVFSARTIEDFIAVLDRGGIPARSVATHASNLHAMREGLALPLDVSRRPFPRASSKDPYCPVAVDCFYQQRRFLRTANRRRHVTAALDLLFGAGATPGEATEAAPGAVTVDADGSTWVQFSGRRAPVLPGYADRLVRTAREAAAEGDTFLIGGTGTTRKNRLGTVLGTSHSNRWTIEVDTTRARATWLVEIATDLGRFPTLPALLDATGLETFGRFSDLLDHIRARSADPVDTSDAGDDVGGSASCVGVAS